MEYKCPTCGKTIDSSRFNEGLNVIYDGKDIFHVPCTKYFLFNGKFRLIERVSGKLQPNQIYIHG